MGPGSEPTLPSHITQPRGPELKWCPERGGWMTGAGEPPIMAAGSPWAASQTPGSANAAGWKAQELPLPQKQGTHSGTHPPAFGSRAVPSSQPASRPAASKGASSPRLGTSFHGEPRGAKRRACAVGASPQRPRPSPLPVSLGWGPSSPELLGSAHRPRPSFQTSQGGSEGSQRAQAWSELGCC